MSNFVVLTLSALLFSWKKAPVVPDNFLRPILVSIECFPVLIIAHEKLWSQNSDFNFGIKNNI